MYWCLTVLVQISLYSVSADAIRILLNADRNWHFFSFGSVLWHGVGNVDCNYNDMNVDELDVEDDSMVIAINAYGNGTDSRNNNKIPKWK